MSDPGKLPSTGEHDKYGVEMFYASISKAKEIYEDNIIHDRTIRGYKTKGKRPDPTDEYNGKMPKEHVDLEATGYFKITQPDHDDTVSVKLRGPTHSNGNGSWYILGVTFYEGKPHFQKEIDHKDGNDDADPGDDAQSCGRIVDKWFGIKAITFNERSEDGEEGVRCQCFVDTGGITSDGKPANKWMKIFDALDTDDPIVEGVEVGDEDELQIQFRIDGCGKIEKKNSGGDNDDDNDKDNWNITPPKAENHRYVVNVCNNASHSPVNARFLSCRQIDSTVLE